MQMGTVIRNPVAFELFHNALDTIVNDMSVVVVSTAYSQIVRDAMDFSTGLCDHKGRLVAQGLGISFHLGAIPGALEAVIKTFTGDINADDVFILNDPYQGGMHLPDIFMFKPVFEHDLLLGFTVVIAHQADIGGRVPGGNAADSTEIFQEGLRIPPVKWIERGVPNTTMRRMLATNVRLPELVLGDLASQLSACHHGEKQLIALYRKHGSQMLELFEELLDYTELRSKQTISDIPDGTYFFEDWLDDNGITSDPVRICVTITVNQDAMKVDFAGTSGQVPGAINCPSGYVRAAVYSAMRFIMRDDCPNNEGFFRPIEVICPEGSVVNPRFPAAVAARGITGYRVADAVLGALGQAVPDKGIAANWGGGTILVIGGRRDNGLPFVLTESIHGNWGARAGKDGIEGVAHPMSNLSNNSVEQLEANFPVQVSEYGFVKDTSGAGKYRGGLALKRAIRLLEGQAVLQVRADRLQYAPWGLGGGLPGTLTTNFLNTDGQKITLGGKLTRPLLKGEEFIHVTAGAGGFGDPLERDPQQVWEDLLDEKISVGSAHHQYAVVVCDSGVDLLETAKLRARRKAI